MSAADAVPAKEAKATVARRNIFIFDLSVLYFVSEPNAQYAKVAVARMTHLRAIIIK